MTEIIFARSRYNLYFNPQGVSPDTLHTPIYLRFIPTGVGL
uniref:Uncharacterized protein n=1 Tax=Siphoviridae sp. ctKNZ79 TaxID=2825440 RepID=A0A8S5U9J7_9CAUD|nr:MAG TPA: hypothetical protein [Siphoviridae sp. ctKNZ79]